MKTLLLHLYTFRTFAYGEFSINLAAKMEIQHAKMVKIYDYTLPNAFYKLINLEIQNEKKGTSEKSYFQLPTIFVTSKRSYSNKLRSCLGVITSASL